MSKTEKPKRAVYMVHVNGGRATFVKELEFFREQGGFEEAWGEAWTPVVATSLEDARGKGAKLLGGRLP